MRFRYKAPKFTGTTSTEYPFYRKQAALWLSRLLDFELPVDDNFFGLVRWISGAPDEFARYLQNNISLPKPKKREEKEAARALKELCAARLAHIDNHLENIFEEQAVLRPLIMDCVHDLLDNVIRSTPVHENPLNGLVKLFSLDKSALLPCHYAFAVGNFRNIEWFLEDQLELGRFTNQRMFAAMLGMSLPELREQLGVLRGLGILESGDNLRLNDTLCNIMFNSTPQKRQALFCRPLPKTTVPYEAFRIPEEEKSHALKILRHKGDAPVHILLYGAPGTGKTSFASCLAKMLKTRAWSVCSRADDSDNDRRVSLNATLALAERSPGSIVLVDEAERMLDTDWDREESSPKAWLNDLLERKGLRIIWITNHVEHIDQAVRRRFSYSIHFENMGAHEAEIMWNTVAKRERVCKKLPAETRKHLAKTYPVPIATMQLAICQAKNIAEPDDFTACVERILKAQTILRNDGHKPPQKKENASTYNPAAICTALPREKIVENVLRLSEKLGGNIRGMGGVLFYGPPGTGKTAFARYLAQRADMECISVQASDLLGMYVGESEKKIRRLFEMADKEKAMLLIDEADSFISSREGAVRTWEVSMVNEFLTNLENFTGLCVCTTNFRKTLDTASMRRFALKVEFAYARAEQIGILYNSLLRPLAAGEPASALLEELCAQKCLAPGDFHAVRSQFFLREPDETSHEELVRALLREQKLKLEGESKAIGF